MVRKLAIAAFALSALSSGVAQALGLGEATVQSALNQPLTAEIELVNVRDLEDNEILTGLAGREEFLRAGVDRVFFLSDLRFKVELNRQGNAVIRVTSSKPVREPFLNFLVEVNWPSGRLLREYALLIDPPTFGEERAAPVQLARTLAPTAPTKPPVPVRQVAPSSVSQAEPSGSNASAEADEVAASYGGDSYGGESYGPTIANDTLWSIAMKTRPNSGVSPQKMMLAIQDLNPEAFLNNNINRLKKGQVLRLPTIDEINARSSREAIATVVAQNEAIKTRSSRPVEATAERQTAAQSSNQARDELRIVVDEASDSITSSPSSSGTEQSTAGTAKVAGKSDTALVQEQLDLRNRENEELKSRLEELQQQLETMQRLVSLKDDQLAVMQGEAALDAGEELASDAENALDVVAGVEAIDETSVDVGSEDEASESEGAEDAIDPSAVDMANDSQPMTAPPVAPENVPEAVPEALPLVDRIINNIKNNVIYQGALAAGGVLLLLLLWLVSRNKSTQEDEFDETALQRQETDVVANIDDIETGTDIPADESTDPIAEADVYLAYQKHDQAARVLEDALEEHPDNQDYRLKLLEVLGESKKAGKFVAVLAALEATGDADILERASNIKTRFTDLAGDSEVSLDDLENQLLSSDSFGSDDQLGNAELSDDFELDVDISESAGLDDTVRQSEAAADFLEKNDFDISSEADIDVDDDLDIDFDLSDIELDDSEVSSEELAGGLDDIDFGEDDQNDSVNDPVLQSGVEEDALLSSASADTDFELDGSVNNALTAADELELDEEFAGLDKFEGLSDEVSGADVVGDAVENALGETDEDILELDLDDLDISLDEDAGVSFDDVVASKLGDSAAGNSSLADIDLEDTVNFVPDAGDSALDGIDLESTIDSSLDDTIAQAMPAGEYDTNQEDLVEDIEEDFDFLSDTDEAATKLDLARAYVDMGDKEGARDILEEVAEEGSDEQKQEAIGLLKTLD